MRTETSTVHTIHPPADIRGTPEGVRLSVEMPGVVPGTLSLRLEDDLLLLAAEKAGPTMERPPVHREISRGRYERAFRVSRDLSREGVTAKYREGVLEVFVPVAEHTKPRTIEVTSN